MPDDIFAKGLVNTPPSIPSRANHPVSTTHVRRRTTPVSDYMVDSLSDLDKRPLQTNKFHANLFLGSQSCPVWTQPYSVWWSKGRGNCQSWGMSVSHIERSGLAFGPKNEHGASRFFFGPIGIQHMCLSAAELGPSTTLYMDSLEQFSANANLCVNADPRPILSLPLVQGMGFITAIYRGCTPQVQSSVFFRDFESCGTLNDGWTEKYEVTLEDGCIWLIYRTKGDNGTCQPLRKASNGTIQGEPGFRGFIQIAKVPAGGDTSKYDLAAGSYAIGCRLSAMRDGSAIRYAYNWIQAGISGRKLLMFGLPHHIESLEDGMRQAVTNIRLWTITKGQATAILSSSWFLAEHVFNDLGFHPYDIKCGPRTQIPSDTHARVAWVAEREVQQDIHAQGVLNSMYFSGKGLAKFAMMAIVLKDIICRDHLIAILLPKLKEALGVFVNNSQPNPLAYNTTWHGVVSVAGLGGDAGADFGNSFYNDHHFHYGYFVYTAAVIAYLDPSWLQDRRNFDYINMLVRDFANPITDDYFPFSRAFDWYEGHSWAKGLFESGDGKDQESSSEDAFASYALKMWAKVTAQAELEATADLRIAVQKRTFCKYFLMETNNTCQPEGFIGNKAMGIAFNNKIDHATYFGANIEYIEGIHMIPCAPVSSITRCATFASEEWNQYFSNGRADKIGGGWRGIIHASQAQFDPKTAYAFFSQDGFDFGWLDGGASLTWYLAYTAALAHT